MLESDDPTPEQEREIAVQSQAILDQQWCECADVLERLNESLPKQGILDWSAATMWNILDPDKLPWSSFSEPEQVALRLLVLTAMHEIGVRESNRDADDSHD